VTFGFFTGVWIYQTRLHERVPALPAWAAYLALLAVFMIPAEGAWRSAVDLAAALVLFPALVTFCANAPARGGVLRVSATIGMLSYGVYVLHVPLWGWLQLALAWLGLTPPGLANVAMVAAAALTAAAVLNVVYDTPLRRRLSKWRPQAAVAAGD
jgi:peptidoglycan/LPS O-acetylase OafA/YrhL